jgi:hypothetical protein
MKGSDRRGGRLAPMWVVSLERLWSLHLSEKRSRATAASAGVEIVDPLCFGHEQRRWYRGRLTAGRTRPGVRGFWDLFHSRAVRGLASEGRLAGWRDLPG